MIYFIRAASGEGAIKIGTTIRLSQRLKQLEKEHGIPLRVLGVMDGSFADESALHAKFVRAGESREWFRADAELTDFIATETRPWDGIDEVPAKPFRMIRLRKETIRKVRKAAALMEISVFDYVSNILMQCANEDLERELKKFTERSV